MPKTETHQLIEQAARELELENVVVEPDLETVGLYLVKWEGGEASIPMAADWKGIIKSLKATKTDEGQS